MGLFAILEISVSFQQSFYLLFFVQI